MYVYIQKVPPDEFDVHIKYEIYQQWLNLFSRNFWVTYIT